MTIKPAKRGAGFATRWHFGLRTLKRAYESSRTVADAEKASIEMAAKKHQRLVDAGKAEWADVGEDGHGFDYGEHLGERLWEEDEVLNHVRTAFLIALYHFVEQRLTSLIPRGENDQKKEFKHDSAVGALKQFGWAPKFQELSLLRLIAHCGKHGEGNSADSLYEVRPDLFDASKIKHGFEPGYYTLCVTDAHVDMFFEAVRLSVPENLGIAF